MSSSREDRLVEEAGGAGVLVNEGAVERPEAVVDALGHVGNQQVRVEVGIAGPTGPVAEHRDGEAFATDALGSGVATPGHGRILLEVGDGLGRGRLVGGYHLGLDRGAAKGVEQGDRLRRRHGDVEAGHGGLAAARSHREQALAGGGVVAAEDELERLGIDLAGQGQVLGQAALPSTGRFAGAEVVVLDPVGDGLEVVVVLARGELADAEHGTLLAAERGLGTTVGGGGRRVHLSEELLCLGCLSVYQWKVAPWCKCVPRPSEERSDGGGRRLFSFQSRAGGRD